MLENLVFFPYFVSIHAHLYVVIFFCCRMSRNECKIVQKKFYGLFEEREERNDVKEGRKGTTKKEDEELLNECLGLYESKEETWEERRSVKQKIVIRESE